MEISRKNKYNDKNYYTNMVDTYTENFNQVLKGLDIVKDFIIENKLIITGGMAIDYALKLKGDKLYEDNQLPDYDFYSSEHWSDAYKLASILCKKGFKNIRVIQGLHITTMRVQLEDITLADVSFLPEKIFNHIPSLKYEGFRFIHPHYQMIDQHSALSRPFDNPGKEVIFSRWEKDMKRYDLLYKYFPVILDKGIKCNLSEIRNGNVKLRDSISRTNTRIIESKKLEIPLIKIKIKLRDIKNLCIVGWCSIDFVIEDEYIIFNIPKNEPLSFASQDYKKNLNMFKNYKFYSGYMDKLPRHLIGDSNIAGFDKNIELFDISMLMISANKISEKHNIYVCNLQWSMLYLMIKILNSKDKSVVFTAEEQYLYCRHLVKLNKENNHLPNINIYGGNSLTLTHIVSLKKFKEQIYQIKAPQLQPVNIYLYNNCDISKYNFNYKNSPYFNDDMREIEEFVKFNIDSYPEYTRKSNV
jgi:hypothetical protein